MAARYKQCIPKLSNEEQQPKPPQPRTSVVRSLNGKSGTPISKILRSRSRKMTRGRAIPHPRKQQNRADIHLRSWDAWRLWREWSGRMKKIANIGIISTTGSRVRSRISSKETYCLFGDSITRRRRNMWPLSLGIQGTRICLPYHWVAMTLPNRKQGRFWYGQSRMSHSHSSSIKVCLLVWCAWTGILSHPLFWLLDCTTVLLWSTMYEISTINPSMSPQFGRRSIRILSGKLNGTPTSPRNSIFIPFPPMAELWIGVSWRISSSPKRYSSWS